MRVLHAALLMSDEPGIRRQMQWEQQAADELELPWTTWAYESPRHANIPRLASSTSALDRLNSVASRAGSSLPARRAFYEELIERSADYDLVLLRSTRHDPFRKGAIRRLACRVASVHHTLEGPELLSLGPVNGRVRAGLEAIFGPPALRASDAVVGVTGEIVEYEQGRARKTMPGLVYPNGCVIAPDDRQAALTDGRGQVPELLFAASAFTPWQGLDLLLDSFAGNSREFVLHLVGRVAQEDLGRATADPRIRVHGALEADQVRALAHRSWLGLSSFALARKRMSEACPLKVREYLSYGLSVYAGHPDVFPAQVTFFEQGPPDIADILRFADARRRVSPSLTLEEARPFVEKQLILGRFYDDLVRVLG